MNTATPTLTLISASPSDLDYDFARRAHAHISMHPERRAAQCQADYMTEMENVEATFAPYATTPEDAAHLKDALEEYRQGYLRHWRGILDARSRTASSMITGPSNFPTARNAKRLATEQRRYDAYVSWRERAYQRLRDQFNPQEPRAISADRDDAVEALQTKLAQAERLQAEMVAANKIVRANIDDDTKLERLISECGLNIVAARSLLTRDSFGNRGFADYQLRNNGAEIRRLRQRIEAVTAQQSRPERRADFDGGYVLDNPANNRVQIFFDAKPDAATRDKLKSNGFRWARSEGAWQRQRTNAGIYAAEQLTGVKF